MDDDNATIGAKTLKHLATGNARLTINRPLATYTYIAKLDVGGVHYRGEGTMIQEALNELEKDILWEVRQ